MVLWHFARRKRPARVDTPVDAEFWVATIDFGLLGFDRHKMRRRDGEPPVTVHPTVLLQLLQLWVPRTDQLDAALMNSLQPLLPHEFDRAAEKVTIKILRTLSRFEDSGDFGLETVSHILVDQAVRGRIGAAKNVDDEVKVISSALAAENMRLDLKARQMEREREGLHSEVEKRSIEIRSLQGEAQTERERREGITRELAAEKEARTALEFRVGSLEARADVKAGWISALSLGAVGAVGLGVIGWWLPSLSGLFATDLATAWRVLVAGFFSVGGLLAASALTSHYTPAIRDSPGARRVRQIAKFYWVVLVIGTFFDVIKDFVADTLFGGANGAVEP